MHWISRRDTTGARLPRRAAPKPRRSKWARRAGLLTIGMLFVCCCSSIHAQQSPEQLETPVNPSEIPAPAKAGAPQSQFLVLLDPAHGGTDTGAMLNADTAEKSYTLALALQLNAALNARGIHSILTRNSDATLDDMTRATIANRSHASACILLHATATGIGVHLFTSSLPAVSEADPRRAFLPWQTAQAAFESSSLRLESDLDAALTQQHLPALLSRTSMMPLDSMACPAVAMEIAPFDANTPLSDPAYRQKIVDSLCAALIAWRGDWGQQP